MKFNDILVQEFLRVYELYRADKFPLWQLASDMEGLVLNMEGKLPFDEIERAMSCAFEIEMINAIVLYENRRPTPMEQKDARNELERIKEIIFKNIENDEDKDFLSGNQ